MEAINIEMKECKESLAKIQQKYDLINKILSEFNIIDLDINNETNEKIWRDKREENKNNNSNIWNERRESGLIGFTLAELLNERSSLSRKEEMLLELEIIRNKIILADKLNG